MAGLRPVVAAACLVLVLPPTGAVTHYERPPCQPDEVQGEVLGLSGYVCSPRCAEGSYDCPGDVPDLAAARPQCMLKDADLGAFCALLCTVDSQCPTSARCNRLAQAGVGVCMYPLSFTDWVHTGTIRRLSYGLPQRADKTVPAGIVQKAVNAVQSLKSKYGIQDGDADVVTVKEFLTALSGGALPGGAGIVPAPPVALGAYGTVAIPAAINAPGMPPGLPSAPRPEGTALNAYRHDLDYHTDRLREGIPGLEKEVTDAMYQVENYQQLHNLSNLLRHLIEFFLVYLVVGVVYKHQALGATGPDMIPHIGFWMEYPQLVRDGVKYSQQVVGGYMGYDSGFSSGFSNDLGGGLGGGGNAGGFEPLGRTGERDTFAHFEPSK